MRKALSVMLGASLSASPAWAQTSESDVQQRLQDYEQRLEQLEKQQFDNTLSDAADRIRINGFLSAGMSRAEVDTTSGSASSVSYTHLTLPTNREV